MLNSAEATKAGGVDLGNSEAGDWKLVVGHALGELGYSSVVDHMGGFVFCYLVCGVSALLGGLLWGVWVGVEITECFRKMLVLTVGAGADT